MANQRKQFTADQWADARAKREAGASFRDVSQQVGIDAGALCRRAKSEKWGDGADIADIVRKRAEAKVNGVDNGINNTVDLKKRDAEIDAAATRMAGVIERHKTEWDTHQSIIVEAVAHKNFELAKLAKITAETIAIRQAGERKAWGLEAGEMKMKVTGSDGGPVKTEATVTHHVADPATLAAAARILSSAGVEDVGEDAGGPD